MSRLTSGLISCGALDTPRPFPPAWEVDLLTTERRLHALVYEDARLCGPQTTEAVEEVEHVLLRLTQDLALPTPWMLNPSSANPTTNGWENGDHPDLRYARVHMLEAMRSELGTN